MSDPIREPEYALHPSPQEYIQGSPLSPDQMGFLRFFNGTTAPFPVHISLDHKPFAAALLPGFPGPFAGNQVGGVGQAPDPIAEGVPFFQLMVLAGEVDIPQRLVV